MNEVVSYGRLNPSTMDEYFDFDWDLVIDACDNSATRYTINQACVKRKIPWIHELSRLFWSLNDFP